MEYLQRDLDKRLDPRKLLRGARSIICTATNYFDQTAFGTPEGQQIDVARYARGRDYHQILMRRLVSLAARIESQGDGRVRTKCCVDTACLAEKAHAARAGLGWIGRNCLLINETLGSWLLLGEIVTDLSLEYDEPVVDRCGQCRRCLEACPTAAFAGPYRLDARRCVSYLTIESQEPLPTGLLDQIGSRLLGCDICQEVCPFNQSARPTQDPDLKAIPGHGLVSLTELAGSTVEQMRQRFADSALKRANWPNIIARAKQLCGKGMSASQPRQRSE
jgi:epoxyqueuosine reductase